jgi:hypothetical protein
VTADSNRGSSDALPDRRDVGEQTVGAPLPSPAPSRRKWRRRTVILIAIPVGILALWIAIHRVPGLGPFLADTGRAIVGPTAIAKLEDFAYGVDDRWQRFWRTDEAPKAYWDVPSAAPSDAPAVPSGSPSSASTVTAYRPGDVEPMHPSWAAPGDGRWVPLVDPRKPDDPPRMHKTLLHPDRSRSWAAVCVVAVDLARADLHLMAGRYEPESKEKEAKDYVRPAVIPAERHADLLGAFNGGFKATHGNHGMRIDGITLIKPRKDSCTLAHYDDGTFGIRTWDAIASEEGRMRWWRQTPHCMMEQGKLHPGLTVDGNTNWGSTIEGSTVIRRSAIGLSEDGKILYIGIGDSTTAPAIAKAMKHAGSHAIAQLDVNWSFPKFLTYEPKEPGGTELIAKPLTSGFEFTEDEYVRQRAQRDFFYLTRKGP